MTVAVVGFFALALAGWVNGVSPYTCSVKAAAGAVAIYIVARIAGRLIASIVADAIVRSMPRSPGNEEQQG